jgi:signal transduction histidine kinase
MTSLTGTATGTATAAGEARPLPAALVHPASTTTKGCSWLLASLLVMAACFVGDLLVPRGATPAIGYALVPVLAANCEKRHVLLALTIMSTLLTWVGIFVEPHGLSPIWMSVLDRAMISGVLWLTLFLIWHRMTLIAALAERGEALERSADELTRSNAELDLFASRVAHDIRGPLNTVGLAADVLERSCAAALSDEDKEWIGGIQSEVRRMGRLIQRLLAYGRVGSGTARMESCDCEALLSGVTRSLAAQLEGCGATLTHDPLPVVHADPLLISELMQNLIENAIKYRSARRPHVHISAAQTGAEVVLAFRDNGVGISDENLHVVFQPFTQLKNVGASSGVGLGLATCKRIVQRHGGRIWVESVRGEGSTFFFALPMRAT